MTEKKTNFIQLYIKIFNTSIYTTCVYYFFTSAITLLGYKCYPKVSFSIVNLYSNYQKFFKF